MAVAAEFILPSGCHVRIMDDDIDYSPEAQERVMERFWRVVRGQIAAQLDAGVPYEEIKRRIAEASAQAERERVRREDLTIIKPFKRESTEE